MYSCFNRRLNFFQILSQATGLGNTTDWTQPKLKPAELNLGTVSFRTGIIYIHPGIHPGVTRNQDRIGSFYKAVFVAKKILLLQIYIDFILYSYSLILL